ncbi:MAG TPA: NADPH-dependent F420 reductase [Egibacteraceae bacterium]|nr:NADPH-dependent F420 reductase [Egibacteraceae bacterium]
MSEQILGFLGGTGPQGRGLAARFAAAGLPVLLGSRDADKGRGAAAELGQAHGLRIDGGANADAAAAADVVFVVVPYAAQADTVAPLAEALRGKVVVHCVNHMLFDERGPYAPGVPGGSAAEECAALLPGANVVSAFHDISARALAKVGEPMDADVLVCGDEAGAKEAVIALAARIPGLRGVDCGPLRMSRAIEDLTPVLVNINRRYKTHASLKIAGL